jgi:CDP-glycerol glycerophosphotransferase
MASGLVTPGGGRTSRTLQRVTAGARHGAGRLRPIRRVATRAARICRRAALHAYYRAQLRAPIDDHLAVFAAYWYRGYACNPRAIYEEAQGLVADLRGVWVVDRAYASRMPPDLEYVVAGTRAYYRLMARAKYFVNNVGFPEEIVKRPETVRVHTHHGTPLKTMGLDQRQAFVRPRMDVEMQRRRWARWDYSITQNAFTSGIWERAYPGPYETLEVGYPRNDILARATDADIARLREALGIGTGRRAVLYAPTHREYLREAPPPLGVDALASALGPEYTILVRAHYLDRSTDLERGGAENVLDVTEHPAIEELLLAADVLITDYSSVMFDYAVLDRPLVIYAPDWEVYRRLRGTYFDLLAEPPGVVATSEDELVEAFRSGSVWGEEAARQRATFRARFCYLDDGFAAERVVRRVWLGEGGESSLPSSRPEQAARIRADA